MTPEQLSFELAFAADMISSGKSFLLPAKILRESALLLTDMEQTLTLRSHQIDQARTMTLIASSNCKSLRRQLEFLRQSSPRGHVAAQETSSYERSYMTLKELNNKNSVIDHYIDELGAIQNKMVSSALERAASIVETCSDPVRAAKMIRGLKEPFNV